jgi:hypothetical protein
VLLLPLGEANLTVKNPGTGDETKVTLIVVPNGHANLLGFKTVQNMGLITVNNDRFIANIVVRISTFLRLHQLHLTNSHHHYHRVLKRSSH